MDMTLSSPAFRDGENIPPEFTCRGDNISPQLEWNSVPAAAKSLVLIMDDPDAPGKTFTHWVLFNIPTDKRSLAEDTPSSPRLNDGSLHGLNDYNRTDYGGPCPPPGRPHHYNFNLYALDITLNLDAGASKEQVLEAMKGHILAQCRLTGLFQR